MMPHKERDYPGLSVDEIKAILSRHVSSAALAVAWDMAVSQGRPVFEDANRVQYVKVHDDYMLAAVKGSAHSSLTLSILPIPRFWVQVAWSPVSLTKSPYQAALRPQPRGMSPALRRARELAIGRYAVPPLAVRYLCHLEATLEPTQQTTLTAFAQYAQCIEAMPCHEPDYQADETARQWFRDHQECS